jgi:hypothetical protein
MAPQKAIPEEWPRSLGPLAEEYGAAAVASAAIDLLGFPAGWITRGGELAVLRIGLAKQQEGR